MSSRLPVVIVKRRRNARIDLAAHEVKGQVRDKRGHNSHSVEGEIAKSAISTIARHIYERHAKQWRAHSPRATAPIRYLKSNGAQLAHHVVAAPAAV